jgi:hypothetical protein
MDRPVHQPVNEIPARQVRPRRHLLGTVAVAMACLLGAAACQPQPRLTGKEFKDLYDRYEPFPGMARLASPPPITGHAGADARIRSIAVGRGYRLRSQHVGKLGTALGVPVDERLVGPLNALAAEARRHGYTLGASFGYRSVDLQRRLFMQHLAGYSNEAIAAGRADGAIDATLRGTAAPGYSKHQGGFTVDFRGGGSFGSSPVGRWMAADNYAVAKRFGFIPNYPPGAGPQGPEPEPWEYSYVGVAVINCSLHLARDNDRPAFDDCLFGTPISRKYRALGGAGGILGPIVEKERALSDGRGRFARYQHGTIYWTRTTDAHEVHGALLDEYGAQGSIRGALRYPTSDTLASSDGKSRYTNFEGGRIYYRGAAGTFTVATPIFARHEALAGVNGALGYPRANVRETTDHTARYQDFTGGRFYVKGTRVTEIHGALLTLHAALGGPAGTLGYPVSDLLPVGDGRGRVQWFEAGYAWYAPTLGAHALWGPVVQRYLANGHAAGALGYPTSEPTAVGDGRGTVATFEHGRIYASTTTAGFDVHGALLTAWLETHGGPAGALGYPTSELATPGTPEGRVQHFEGGTLRLNGDGTVTLDP